MTPFRLVSDGRADLDVEAAFDWYENEQAGLGLNLENSKDLRKHPQTQAFPVQSAADRKRGVDTLSNSQCLGKATPAQVVQGVQVRRSQNS